MRRPNVVMHNPKIEIRKTGRYGDGVFAACKILKNEIVAVYDGPIYPYDYALWSPQLEDHVIQCGENEWRATDGLAKFINHSCEPNCGVKGLFEFVAMRDVEADEELTYDYEMTENHPEWSMLCICGKPTCRTVIGQYRNMPQSVRENYKGYISAWLHTGS